MVVTVVEAHIPGDREADLVTAYEGATKRDLPPPIVETFLLHAVDSDKWRIATVWRSKEELDSYRASVETPEAVKMFRAAGAEPSVAIFDVIHHAEAEGPTVS